MQRRFKVAVFAVVIFILGIIPLANAQQDIIDNLKIDTIKSIQVRDGGNIFLDVKTIIKNLNEKEIRLRKSTFTFSFGSTCKCEKDYTKKETAFDAPPKPECDVIASKNDIEDKNKEIGTAQKPYYIPMDCDNGEDIYLKPQIDNIVVFHVNIGRSPGESFGNLMHIMNCIGYPEIKTPFINIKGMFDLGVKSAKGWSEVVSVKIEWLFTPGIQEKVNFMEGAK